MTKIAVLIPCYNEEGNILILNDKIKEVLNNINYQIIYVNDGSTDNTYNKFRLPPDWCDNSGSLLLLIHLRLLHFPYALPLSALL